jgi:hypothetical protein
MRWCYYLHTNGSLIGKNPIVLKDPDYFDSPFVKKHWIIDTENRAEAWDLVLEAIALGADKDRLRELVEKWGLTKKDCKEYIIRTPNPTPTQKEGLKLFFEYILDEDINNFFDDIAKTASKVK